MDVSTARGRGAGWKPSLGHKERFLAPGAGALPRNSKRAQNCAQTLRADSELVRGKFQDTLGLPSSNFDSSGKRSLRESGAEVPKSHNSFSLRKEIKLAVERSSLLHTDSWVPQSAARTRIWASSSPGERS